MAANAVVQARIDRAVREEAATVLASMGLTVSDAVRLLLTRIANEHSLPFDLVISNRARGGAMREAHAGKLALFERVNALMADLQLNADNVEILRQGNDVIVRKRRENLREAFDLLASMPDDFFADARQDPPPEERESL